VTGTIRDDEPEMGAECYEVEIERVEWPGGGEVDERLYDREQLEDDFLKEGLRCEKQI
jgi:hypothetical protein